MFNTKQPASPRSPGGQISGPIVLQQRLRAPLDRAAATAQVSRATTGRVNCRVWLRSRCEKNKFAVTTYEKYIILEPTGEESGEALRQIIELSQK